MDDFRLTLYIENIFPEEAGVGIDEIELTPGEDDAVIHLSSPVKGKAHNHLQARLEH